MEDAREETLPDRVERAPEPPIERSNTVELLEEEGGRDDEPKESTLPTLLTSRRSQRSLSFHTSPLMTRTRLSFSRSSIRFFSSFSDVDDGREGDDGALAEEIGYTVEIAGRMK